MNHQGRKFNPVGILPVLIRLNPILRYALFARAKERGLSVSAYVQDACWQAVAGPVRAPLKWVEDQRAFLQVQANALTPDPVLDSLTRTHLGLPLDQWRTP